MAVIRKFEPNDKFGINPNLLIGKIFLTIFIREKWKINKETIGRQFAYGNLKHNQKSSCKISFCRIFFLMFSSLPKVHRSLLEHQTSAPAVGGNLLRQTSGVKSSMNISSPPVCPPSSSLHLTPQRLCALIFHFL